MFKTAVTALKFKKSKKRVPGPDEGHLLKIPKALEEAVLLFADRKHKGFAEAYSRVKSWADFPDFKRKVPHSTERRKTGF